MSSSLRGLLVLSEYLRFPATVAASVILLAGCSADVTRFDFPVFGLTDNSGGATAAVPAPSEPVTGYAANDQVSGYSPAGQSGPAAPRKTAADYGGYGGSNTSGSYGSNAPYGESGPQDLRAPRRDDVNVSRLPGVAEQSPPSGYRPQPSGYDLTSSDSITVRSGDTLYRISRRHSVSIASIMASNGLSSPTIKVGQRLIIPVNGPTSVAANRDRTYYNPDPAPSRPVAYEPTTSGGSYRVRTGDSLYGIARRNGVRVAALQQANNIGDPTKLRVGQVLIIPAQGATYADRGPVPSPQDSGRRRVAALDERTTNGDAANYGDSRRAPSRYDTGGDGQRSSLGGYGKDYQSDTGDDVTRTASLQESDTARFRWPVNGRIISGFGQRQDGTHNDGIDIAVPTGTSVQAVDNGVVAYAGSELKGYGKLILIRHSDNWVSAYAHNEQLMVRRGDKIRRGQVIAKAGRSGSVERPQLHFELRQGSKPVDPMKHLASR